MRTCPPVSARPPSKTNAGAAGRGAAGGTGTGAAFVGGGTGAATEGEGDVVCSVMGYHSEGSYSSAGLGLWLRLEVGKRR